MEATKSQPRCPSQWIYRGMEDASDEHCTPVRFIHKPALPIMGLKVLIIDDSSLMRKMINRAIRQCAIDVAETFEAENGQEGLQALSANSPDLILCDWNMPVMDGITFVAEARKSTTTPIIMLTTEGTDSKKAEAMAAGASGYVTKPFTPDKLEEAIKRSTAA